MRSATTGLDIRWFCGKPDLAESPIGYKPAAQVRAQTTGNNLDQET